MMGVPQACPGQAHGRAPSLPGSSTWACLKLARVKHMGVPQACPGQAHAPSLLGSSTWACPKLARVKHMGVPQACPGQAHGRASSLPGSSTWVKHMGVPQACRGQAHAAEREILGFIEFRGDGIVPGQTVPRANSKTRPYRPQHGISVHLVSSLLHGITDLLVLATQMR
eukprot:gene16018-biopygen12710